ncbi:MAG: SGNH/GDSL hydrolase family protein [Planctomycetes bacterium]|nr:SGNH/GDSL hydrolase family protein [Planctomycetota bacterium]
MVRLAACLFVAIIASAASADPTPISLKKGDRIVFLGDSITAGGNSGKGYIQVIRGHLADKKKDLAIECIGAGISGNKVPDLQKRVDKHVVARKPTIVVIYIGINDVWHGEKNPKNGTAPAAFEAGLKEVIGKCTNAGAQVVLCTPSVIGELPGGANNLDKKLDEYSDISRKVAKEMNLNLCDLRKAFVDHLQANNAQKKASGILTSDRVHLNEAGNRLVAQTILKTLGE